MEFLKKKMNKIFKLLIFVLLVEITLGYLIYIKNTRLISGYFMSSTVRALVKVNKSFRSFTDRDIKKDIEINLTNCEYSINKNVIFNIAGFNSYRKKIPFQTNLKFINSFDQNKDYLILILGNSEVFGDLIEDKEGGIHVDIQNKLMNKINLTNEDNLEINKGKIFVVNISQPGGMMADHLTDLLNFSEIYSPDLAIFYTGGNELKLTGYYKQILQKEFYSEANNKFYSYDTNKFDQKEFENCLNRNNFVTRENIVKSNFLLNVEDHIKDVFEKIDNNLTKKSINYLFYIQPINNTIAPLPNHKKMKNISIPNKNFINLNLDKNLKLDFIDLFHTKNFEQTSSLITNDIWKVYKNDIQKKISSKVN